jgi:membrane protease YdiL (CAAX protease family)
MYTPRQLFIRLAIAVVVWYFATTQPQQFLDICLSGSCSGTFAELTVSVLFPLLLVAGIVAVEAALFRVSISQAVRRIGLTHVHWNTVLIAFVICLPLLAFYPLMSLFSGVPLPLTENWLLVAFVILLFNGVNEEAMFRGFVFRHLREGRTFWRAASLSVLFFAVAHIPLVLTLGPVFGISAILLSVPAAYTTAFLYERGRNSIWASAVLHGITNTMPSIFVLPAEVAQTVTPVYLVVSMIVSVVVIIVVYRSGFGRGESQSVPLS